MNRNRYMFKINRPMSGLLTLAMVAALLPALATVTARTTYAAPTVVAFDMVNSASLNLTSFTDDPAIPFTSAGDGFQKFQRGVSPSIPFAVLDDSLSIFPSDSLGIIKEANTDVFFGVSDTENPDNSGPVSAEWVFDITGATDLSLSIDMGAMGDFESSDTFVWTYQIDGGPVLTAFASTVDEAGSHTYTLEGGASFTLSDPMLVDGTVLTNDLQTFTTPLTGSGSLLTLTLTAQTDGGSEAFAFQNISISGTPAVDNPPQVSSTAPTDSATGVSLDTAITLDFDESVDVASGALSLECPTGSAQAFSTSPALPASDVTSVTMTPDGLLPPGTTCVVTAAAAGITDRDGTPDPLDGDGDGTGGDDYVFSFTTVDCGAAATLIHDIQSDGATSPEEGNVHTIEGIVVGDFQRISGNDQLSGFFVQEENSDWDSDDATSEGIFVYEGSTSLLDVEVGDKVRLTGEVDEYYDLTELKYLGALGRCSSGNATTAVPVALPETVDGELEQYEGMLVEIASESDMTVAQNYFLGRYGQMTLSASGRMFQPTNQFLPGSPEALALADANTRRLLILDDGMDVSSCGDNPDPVPYLGPPPPAVIRAGDEVSNLVGVLDYGKINSGTDCGDQSTFARDYRLHPTQDPDFTAANPRTAAPDDVGGELKVASFNVLNYFTTLAYQGDICGPTGGQECRGAYTTSEFERQQMKIVKAMCAIDADIFGLMELENQNPDNDPEPGDGIDNYVLKDLVDALNDADSPCPDRTYAFTDSPAIGTDAIRQGIIYKMSTVTPVGRAVLDDAGFTDPNNTGEQQSRPAIAETFEDAKGARFTVVVNHLKSKGSPCGPGDDDTTTGQGNCNDTRTKGADYLVGWLTTDPTSSGDADFLVIGDLNAYGMEDPIMELIDGGYTDLLDAYQGETAYTYIFDGQSGYLDHALANPALVGEVTGATEWHINADEPAVIDYSEYYNPEGYYSPDAYRASDHDPVIVGLNLCTDEIPPTLDVTVSPDTLWPPNHKYVTVQATVDISDNIDPTPTLTLVSVTSNEPDDGLGDGDTPDDIVIVDEFTFELRAERSGTGDGRVYTITYEATDACGNSTTATATVTVPHS